jgi:hypothetical protein
MTQKVCSRGGHRHRQVVRMPDTDLIPDIRSKGVKYHYTLSGSIPAEHSHCTYCIFYTEFTLIGDELFYSIPLGLDNEHPPQSKELVRGPPELVQHFRL